MAHFYCDDTSYEHNKLPLIIIQSGGYDITEVIEGSGTLYLTAVI